MSFLGNLMITSESNAIIKHIKGLKQKKNREKHHQFIIEGLRILQEALDHGGVIEYILYSDSLMKLKGGTALLDRVVKEKYQLVYLSDKLLEKLADTEQPQGVMAVVNRKNHCLQTLLKREDLFLVVLDRIQDPGNLGTIIRTAEGAGVHGILLTKGCVDPYNSKTLRSTMGAVFHLPLIQWEGAEDIFEPLTTHGVRVIATDLTTEKYYDRISYGGKIALVFGNEANGIEQDLLAQAHEIVKIPIPGKIESLNASVAAGILIYKALENRSCSKI